MDVYTTTNYHFNKITMYNKITIIGNLGKDPDIKTFDNGEKLASFSVATSFTYKTKDGEKKTITTWHNAQAKAGLVTVVEKYLHKGDKVFIEGMQLYREYEKDGVKRTANYIAISNLVMLGSKQEGGAEAVEGNVEDDDDGLPF